MTENESPHAGIPATVATTDSAVEALGPPPPATTGIDWIQLALSLREPEIEILRLVYLPDAVTRPFLEVYTRLERLGYSQRTARRKIAFLARQNLIVRVYSVLGFIGPAPGQAEGVKRLLEFLERRRQYPNPRAGISEALLELAGDQRGAKR